MLKTKMWYLIVFLIMAIPLCAPESVCEELFPFHDNIRLMTTASSFHIETMWKVNGSAILTVKLKSAFPELKLEGFMMHAHSTSIPYKVVSSKIPFCYIMWIYDPRWLWQIWKLGRFISSIDGLKLFDCAGEDNFVVYHASSMSEGDIQLQWQAPNNFFGDVVFKYDEHNLVFKNITNEYLQSHNRSTIW